MSFWSEKSSEELKISVKLLNYPSTQMSHIQPTRCKLHNPVALDHKYWQWPPNFRVYSFSDSRFTGPSCMAPIQAVAFTRLRSNSCALASVTNWVRVKLKVQTEDSTRFKIGFQGILVDSEVNECCSRTLLVLNVHVYLFFLQALMGRSVTPIRQNRCFALHHC